MAGYSGSAFAGCLMLGFLAPAISFAQEAPAKLADARPGDVRLFVSGALLVPVMAVKDSLEKATGHKLVIESGGSRSLQDEIEAGQPFELALVTQPVIDAMIAKGRIAAGSVPIAVVRVGVAARGAAPHLDVGTPEGLKKAMLGAYSVRHATGAGAAVPTVDNMFAKIALDDALKDKVVMTGATPVPDIQLPPGQYELTFALASEAIPMKGWTYLGLIPEQYQLPVYLAAGVGSAGDAAMARKIIAVLQAPSFDRVLSADGMTRR